ncbi:uncharacterized protein LOC122618047 [Drosophila teissieri]|uniref:uncharacterized protein LOC122618047 n=1 Tax=Drosophila teissieri TaxID=7243 RepID=UPI001CBA10A3|nr:uncharacterized protein LOC122618047 [Drosophila teissieri]
MSKPINVNTSVPNGVKRYTIFQDLRSLNIFETNIQPYCQYHFKMSINIKEGHDVTGLIAFPKLKHFHMIGQHKPGSMAPFLKLAARKGILSTLHLHNADLSLEEVLELALIYSLKALTCGFSDFQTIGLLTKLDNLCTLTITTELNADIGRQVVEIFRRCNGKIIIQVRQRAVQFRMEWQPQPQRLSVYLPYHDPIDMNVLTLLAELQDVRYLTIRGSHLSGSLAGLFRGFGAGESTKLQEVIISNSYFLTSEETAALASIKTLKVLECEFGKASNTELLSHPAEPREICLPGLPKNSMKPLFEALASKREPTLEYFVLSNGELDDMESESLSKIKSLKYLTCRFKEVKSLKHIRCLPNLDYAYISVEQRDYYAHETSKHLLRFLVRCRKEAQVRFRGCDVGYYQPEGRLIVTFKKKEANAALCSLLGRLGTIKNLRISGRPTAGKLKVLLKGVLHHNLVHVLHVGMLRVNELPIVANMNLLTKITIGFLQPEKIELLARLHHLKWLCITDHPQGALEHLFHDLAVRIPASQLETLSILRVSVVPAELVELARINSLRRLRCALENPSDEWSLNLLSVHSMIEELHITSYQSGSLEYLFKALQLITYFHRLIVWRSRLTTSEVKAIMGIHTLRTLHCSLQNARDIGILEHVPLLEELVIEDISIIHRNPLALWAHKERQTLRKLVINNRSLARYDFHSLALMTSLKCLDCLINNSCDIECLALLNLTELILHCPHEVTITPLLTALIAKDSHVLRSFELRNKLLRKHSTELLIQIRSLRNLKIGFTDLKGFELLAKKTDLEILEITNNVFEVNRVLEIIRNCRKLREIHFVESNDNINTEFIGQCMDALKTVRNHEEQKPLQLFFDSLYCLSLKQQYYVDESYMIIRIKKRPTFDDFDDEFCYEPSDDGSDIEEPNEFCRIPNTFSEISCCTLSTDNQV